MIAALVEQYVDDTSPDFAILPSAGSFKDFVKSYFVGTVASGLAYLAMIQDGYQWADHFENVAGGNPSATRAPDFVFTGNGTGTALVESKGTRSAGRATFDSTVEAGYLGQVEPHLGHTVNGLCATHGYAVGSWLTSTTKAELLIHHTAASTVAGNGERPADPSLEVQRHNYATAMQLVHGLALAAQLRQGLIEYVPPMLRFEWLGRTWLTRLPWASLFHLYPSYLREWRLEDFDDFDDAAPLPFAGFAIDEQIASSVFSYFTDADRPEDTRLAIEPIPPNLAGEARRSYDGEAGAVFPDGLAVIGWENPLFGSRRPRGTPRWWNRVWWNQESRSFR